MPIKNSSRTINMSVTIVNNRFQQSLYPHTNYHQNKTQVDLQWMNASSFSSYPELNNHLGCTGFFDKMVFVI